MELSYDHKVALFDRIQPHIDVIEGALNRKLEELPTFDDEVSDALHAVGVVKRSAQAVAERPADPAPYVKTRTWWGGRLVLASGDGSFSLVLTLGWLCLGLGVDRERRDVPPCLGVDLELIFERGVGLRHELRLWRHVPWIFASLGVDR